MKLRAVSRGCCGRIRWCRLAYLSQKAASAVQKTRWLVSPVCCESPDEWEHSGASHTQSLAVSSFLALLSPQVSCVCFTRECDSSSAKKKGGGVDGGIATSARVRGTQWVRSGFLAHWSITQSQLLFPFFWVLLLFIQVLLLVLTLSSEQGTEVDVRAQRSGCLEIGIWDSNWRTCLNMAKRGENWWEFRPMCSTPFSANIDKWQLDFVENTFCGHAAWDQGNISQLTIGSSQSQRRKWTTVQFQIWKSRRRCPRCCDPLRKFKPGHSHRTTCCTRWTWSHFDWPRTSTVCSSIHRMCAVLGLQVDDVIRCAC